MSKRYNTTIKKRPSKRLKQNDNSDIHELNQKDKFGNSPIHIAIMQENRNEVMRLLKLKVEVNTAGYLKYSPLQLAVKSQKEAFVKMLLAAGADLTYRNMAGQTALHLACSSETFGPATLNILQLLVANKADVNVTDSRGQTPLHYACAQSPRIECIVLLLSYGANVSSKDNNGHTPLQVALNENCKHVTAAALLLMHGAEDDLNAQDPKGATFLHHAVTGTDITLPLHLINTLVRLGANVSVKNALGQTPLHLACEELRDLAAAFTLLDLGAGVDVNVQDHRGRTPLHLAAANQCPLSCRLIEKLLREYWGIIDIMDKNGHTPLDMALEDPINRSDKWIIFREHAFKLKCINLLPRIIYEFDFKLLDSSVKSVKSLCLKEVEAMTKIKSGRHTLYDIFFNRPDPLHFANKKLVKRIESSITSPKFERKFPIYKDVIIKSFTQSKQRLELLNKAQECMTHPSIYELRRIVLVYLDDQDLMNLIAAYSCV